MDNRSVDIDVGIGGTLIAGIGIRSIDALLLNDKDEDARESRFKLVSLLFLVINALTGLASATFFGAGSMLPLVRDWSSALFED